MTKGHFCVHYYEMHNQNSAKKIFFFCFGYLVHKEVILKGTGIEACSVNLSQ